MNNVGAGPWVMLTGAAIIVYMMFRWFGQVIGESESGTYNEQVDRSFRWGMAWFIFSEVMFFAAFFGALFYVRQWAVQWLGDRRLLWPGYDATWPTAGPKGPMPIAADSTPGQPVLAHGRLGHPGDQHPDPAHLGRNRHLGALGPAQGQPLTARDRPVPHRRARPHVPFACRPTSTPMPTPRSDSRSRPASTARRSSCSPVSTVST